MFRIVPIMSRLPAVSGKTRAPVRNLPVPYHAAPPQSANPVVAIPRVARPRAQDPRQEEPRDIPHLRGLIVDILV
jgi:hypothetical protein